MALGTIKLPYIVILLQVSANEAKEDEVILSWKPYQALSSGPMRAVLCTTAMALSDEMARCANGLHILVACRPEVL